MPKVNRQILELIYHTDGGFSWKELYSEMPIYIRQFMVRELDKIKDEEKKKMEKEKSNSSSSPVSGPPEAVSNAMDGGSSSSSPDSPADAQKLGKVLDSLQS